MIDNPLAGRFDHLWHSLLNWYAENKRELPWRTTRDPYAILVSETMLQQTGVERVIPKYVAFLAELPTLESLAQAPTGAVIRLWAGLGYNRRAVWLQRAAQEAIQRWGGLPSSIADLQLLPGIGPYTARAVACFAFAAQVAVVDTNVRRVLRRVLAGAGGNGDGAASLPEGQLLALAERVLPPGCAYDWNQALMDLGATICTHHAPRCLSCPLQSSCLAYPAILAQGAHIQSSVAEAKPRWKESPFVGSRRYYRGRIVDELRRLVPGSVIPLIDLGALIKDDFSAADLPWLHDLVQELAADGLARIGDEGCVALP